MSNENVENKIAKLPVWAQNYISKLESDLKHCKNTVDVLEGNVESRISYGFAYTGKHPIPENCGPVCFQLGDDCVSVNISKTREGEVPTLEINSNYGVINVVPWASNVIKIKTSDH